MIKLFVTLDELYCQDICAIISPNIFAKIFWDMTEHCPTRCAINQIISSNIRGLFQSAGGFMSKGEGSPIPQKRWIQRQYRCLPETSASWASFSFGLVLLKSQDCFKPYFNSTKSWSLCACNYACASIFCTWGTKDVRTLMQHELMLSVYWSWNRDSGISWISCFVEQ